jgi:hypothetical protein
VLAACKTPTVTLPNCNDSITKMQLQTGCAAMASHCALHNIQRRNQASIWCLRLPSCSLQKPNHHRMSTNDTAARTQTCQQATQLLFSRIHNTTIPKVYCCCCCVCAAQPSPTAVERVVTGHVHNSTLAALAVHNSTLAVRCGSLARRAQEPDSHCMLSLFQRLNACTARTSVLDNL